MELLEIPMPSDDELNADAGGYFDAVSRFNIDQWPDDVAALSMPTKFVEIADIAEFLTLYDYQSADMAIADRYAAEIDAAIGWDQTFIRLNTRSPKDITAPVAPITVAGKQAIHWILCSERCLDDLVMMRRAKARAFICLREWKPIFPANEFRCFAKGGKVIGVSRYDYGNPAEYTGDGSAIVARAEEFYAANLARHYGDVVFDLAFMSDGLLLIELNPYGLSNPCCFGSYAEIEERGGYAG